MFGGHVCNRDTTPASGPLGRYIVVDVFCLQILEPVARLFAPQQESAGYAPPLFHRRRCQSAFVAHPANIPVELRLVRQYDSGLTPPAKELQPGAPDIDDATCSGSRTVNILPSLRDRQQLRHADAGRSLWTEMSRDPQEFVAFDPENFGSRSECGAVMQIAVPLVSKWHFGK
uniref:Riorf2 protein n=1 Tax=Rhizobium rhizogenes TaxID=359 RepID=Q9F5I5_RHIRH|nr:riorf2 [Rhizobium rhizogenes]